MRIFFTLISILSLFHSFNALAQESACRNASQLWKWSEGREQRIIASAQCGGTYFKSDLDDQDLLLNISRNVQSLYEQNSNQFQPSCHVENIYGPTLSQNVQPTLHFAPSTNYSLVDVSARDSLTERALIPDTIVKVESTEAAYVDQKNGSNFDIAQIDTTQKLIAECAKAVFAEKAKSDPLFASRKSFSDVQKQIRLRVPKLNAAGATKTSEYSYVKAELSDAQKRKIISVLNQANSCSSFELANSQGGKLSANCDEFTAARLEDYRKQEVARIAMAVALGAAGNYFRGGQILPTGSTQSTRFLNSLISASIRPIVTGEPIDWSQFAWDAARSDLAQTIYVTNGYVAGGTMKNSISKTILSGAASNALYFGLTCADAKCSVAGLPAGIIYTLFGQLADSKYSIFGLQANGYSEAVTGGLLGLALGMKYASDHEHDLSNRLLTLDLARISSQDLCIDVSDILQ